MKSPHPTNTVGGRVDQTAIVGHAPESRDWRPGDGSHHPYIDPTARLEAFVTVDSGLLDSTYIGPGVWLMKHTHVGHDAVIGAGCELAPHCSVGGHATLGQNVKVGMGALFKPYVTVGDGARVGMGAVVIHDVVAGDVVAGNPAKSIRKVAE